MLGPSFTIYILYIGPALKIASILLSSPNIGTGHKLLLLFMIVWACPLNLGMSSSFIVRPVQKTYATRAGQYEEERRMQFLIQFSDKFICDRELVDQKLSR